MSKTQFHNQNKLSIKKLEKKSSEIIDVYVELSKLPPELADRITNAKTGGGRSLSAIWNSSLRNNEKMILLLLGSELNYCENFSGQYRYISLSKIAEKTSLNHTTVRRILNGYKDKKGLIEKGYMGLREATKEEQMKGWSNHYCLTSKVFDEYMVVLIKKAKETLKEESIQRGTPPGIMPPPPRHHAPPPGGTMPPKVPSYKTPSMNTPVCGEKSGDTHTHKKIRKEDLKNKSMTNGIPTAICRTLSDTLRLRQMFNLPFLANETCAVIISNVLKESSCTHEGLLTAILDLPNYPCEAIFKSKRINIQSNSQDLVKWVTERDLIIRGYEDKQNDARRQELADFEELRVLQEARKFTPKRAMRMV